MPFLASTVLLTIIFFVSSLSTVKLTIYLYSRKGLSRSDNVNRHEENCRNNPVNSQSSLPQSSRRNPRRNSTAPTATAVFATTAASTESTRDSVATSSSVRVNTAIGAPPRTRPSAPSLVPPASPSGPSSARDANVFLLPSSSPTPLVLRTQPMRRVRNRAHPYFLPSRL